MPAAGGQEQSQVLGPELSSYELDGLEPATHYRIWLSVLGTAGEGPPSEVTAYTGVLLPLPMTHPDFLYPMTLSDSSCSPPLPFLIRGDPSMTSGDFLH